MLKILSFLNRFTFRIVIVSMEVDRYYYNSRCKDPLLRQVKKMYPDAYKGFLWMTMYGVDQPHFFKIYRFDLDTKGKLSHIYTWVENKRVALAKLPAPVLRDPYVVSLIRKRRQHSKRLRKAA